MGTFVVYLDLCGKWHYRSIDQWGLIPSNYIDIIAREVARTEVEGVVDSPVRFSCAVHAGTPSQAKKLGKEYYKQYQLKEGVLK